MKKNSRRRSITVSYCSSVVDLIKPFRQKELFATKESENQMVAVTGDELINRVMLVGSLLQQKMKSQQKVILLFPQGLDYIYGMLACWYANLVVIPVPLTDLTKTEVLVETIDRILKDSNASCILTNAEITQLIGFSGGSTTVPVIDISQVYQSKVEQKNERSKGPDELSIILYSSGSNSQPKGIMITHQSLMSQANVGAKQWGMSSESCIVSWMPQFHSFGLHFNILAPLSKGAFSVMLEPSSFLKNPDSWFECILEHKATHTAAPNFAFDYCFEKVNVAAFKSANQFPLTTIKAIVCGGEPINKQSYSNFIKRFECLGLSAKSICSHYGLSEIGSVVTSSVNREVQFKSLDLEKLENNLVGMSGDDEREKVVVSCGEVDSDMMVVVVDPGTLDPCSNGKVGEILVKSPSVASGYINKQEESDYTFSAKIDGDKETNRYLRTGDLGFIENKHLYVVGREKDLIIINGKNHHPVDIEWSIKKNVSYLDLAVVVFSQEIANEEKVIVVQEIKSEHEHAEYNTMIIDIQNAVAQHHSIKIHEIYLVSEKSIPRTGSGKIQKQACRNLHKEGKLSALHQYVANLSLNENRMLQTKSKTKPKADNIKSIVETLKEMVFSLELNVPMAELERINEFSQIMLNSIQYVTISKKIEEIFEFQFPPVMLFKYASFTKLAGYLHEQINSLTASNDITTNANSKVKTHVNYSHRNDILSAKENQTIDDKGKQEKLSIAIIGMSGHFPGGATDLDKFWDNLVGQVNCITPIPTNRKQFSQGKTSNSDFSSYKFPNWGGFLSDVDTFDAGFFGISPVEANSMDPQQRKVLEMTWSVIENGGYNPKQLANKNVGLFIGAHNNDYLELVLEQPALSEMYGAYLDSGVHMSMIANRVSRWFDFNGPSEVINTACSSSLVAVHHAVESILKGDCNLAIAGGINLILSPRIYKAAHSAGMLSIDGSCKSFDKKANGFVRAEGYGAVLLKSYHQAKIDNDTIYAVIKSAVINHDGKSDSLRAPNLESQTKLIKSAYESADVSPDSISYIETHGTGTPLGDPIETEALKEAFLGLSKKLPLAYCGLGTVKTNIGHCESAAGIAGLIKVILSLEKKILPGILHFNKLNDAISLENSPFYVVKENQEWKPLKGVNGERIPLRAGVSSFGFGGVNAHLVLEEAPLDDAKTELKYISSNEPANKRKLILLSARSSEQLQIAANNLYSYLLKLESKNGQGREINDSATLQNIAYTLQVGRHAMKERIAMTVESKTELRQMLSQFLSGKPVKSNFYRGAIDNDFELLQWSSDEGIKAAITRWLTLNELEKLATSWVKGLEPAWQIMYGEAFPKRISLPTYPFANSRYWLPDYRPEQHEVSIDFIQSKGNALVGKKIETETLNNASRNLESDELINFVKGAIANTTGHSIEDVALSAELEDLGIDSVSRLKFVNEIVNEHSYVALEHSELLVLPRIIDIVNYLRERISIELLESCNIKTSEVGSRETKSIEINSSGATTEHRASISQDILLCVKKIIANNTGHEIQGIDVHSDLADLGIDSIIRLKLANEIVNAYPVLSLDPNRLLMLPNVDEIVRFLNDEAGETSAICTNKTQVLGIDSKIDCLDGDKDSENITYRIKEIVAGHTGYSIDELDLSDEFDELGVDSIIRLKLTNEIVNEYPELSLEHNEMLMLEGVSGVVALIENELKKVKKNNFGMQNSSSERADGFEFRKNNKELERITKGLKEKSSNIVIRNVRPSVKEDSTLEATVIVGKENLFFNDHPLDHVTGIQLIESMMQLVKVSEINCGNMSDYYITSMNVRFEAFCENESADVFCSENKYDAITRSKSLVARVQQNQEVICNASINIKNASLPKNNVASKSKAKTISKLRRCSRSMVNKRNIENVFISTPSTSSGKQGCWFFPNRSNTMFSDNVEKLVDVTQLIEACRQHERSLTKRSFFQTSTEEHISVDVDKQQNIVTAENSIGVLKSLDISFSRALLIDEEIFITNGDMNVIDVGGNRVIDWQSELLINDEVVGVYKMQALLLSRDIYDTWRSLESEEVES